MNDKYLNVLKRLYNTNRFKQKKVDLNSIIKACDLLNNPQKSVDYIHVTGTNGKGSVCKKISSILTKSGYKTGLFISPHISTFRERMQIDNKYIEKEYIAEELERIFAVCDKNNCDMTYFEYVTLLSFNYFRDNKVDAAVMEVGLGGNLDATNVIDPLISVITTIGMDHMDSLGFTQTEIAEKKSGIIKPKRPVLLGYDCYPRNVFLGAAEEKGSNIYICEKSMVPHEDYDLENREIARRSIDLLIKYYPHKFTPEKLSNENIEVGLKQKQPCRMEDVFDILTKEKVEKNLFQKIFKSSVKKIFLDVGHNPHGLEKMLRTIRENFPRSKIKIVCSFSSNKDKDEIFKIICSLADKIYLCSPNHPRVTPYTDLGRELQEFLLNYNFEKSLFNEIDLKVFNEEKYINKNASINGISNVKETILKCVNDCQDEKNNEDIIIICGSFFMMADARKVLGYIDEIDPVELNEINPIKFNI